MLHQPVRKFVLGVAAVAAMSVAAMMPAAASAKDWKHHHHFHGHHWGGPKFIVGGGYDGWYVKRLVETPYGLRYRIVNVCF